MRMSSRAQLTGFWAQITPPMFPQRFSVPHTGLALYVYTRVSLNHGSGKHNRIKGVKADLNLPPVFQTLAGSVYIRMHRGTGVMRTVTLLVHRDESQNNK